jgi:Flp pilus assembly CpaE family ATPase
VSPANQDSLAIVLLSRLASTRYARLFASSVQAAQGLASSAPSKQRNRGNRLARVISTINLKGGVGKTTTTVGLAEFLSAEFGKKVLVIDLDPQTNATIVPHR